MKLTQEQKEHREAWAKALKSGEYTQGLKRLKTVDGGYCCLGVACDIYMKTVKDGEWDDDRDDYGEFVLGSERRRDTPPVAVAKYFGLTDHDCAELTALNDEERAEFAYIADVILSGEFPWEARHEH